MSIGERVKIERKKKGLSQNELSKIAGISQSALSAIENNTKNPSVVTIKLLADALNYPLSDLIGNSTEPAPMESRLDNELVTMLVQLSPSDVRRVRDFVQGILAARKE